MKRGEGGACVEPHREGRFRLWDAPGAPLRVALHKPVYRFTGLLGFLDFLVY